MNLLDFLLGLLEDPTVNGSEPLSRDKLEDLVDKDDGETDEDDGDPLLLVERHDREHILQR